MTPLKIFTKTIDYNEYLDTIRDTPADTFFRSISIYGTLDTPLFQANHVEKALGYKKKCLKYQESSHFRYEWDLHKVKIRVPTTRRYHDVIAFTKAGLIRTLTRVQRSVDNSIYQFLGVSYIAYERAETATIEFIMKSFEDVLKINPQYKVGPYKVDAYISRLNVVLECDEIGHRNYNLDKDTKRTRYIDEALNKPIWIRYDPDKSLTSIMNRLIKLTIIG